MIRRALNQEATLWSNPLPDGYGGFKFSTPKIILVRWEENSVEFTSPGGQIEISNAVVWTPLQVKIGSYIALGNLLTEANPTKVDDAYIVRNSRAIPDIRNIETEWRAFL